MMTVSIANRVINIHVSAAIAILLFTITSVWLVRDYTDQIRENNGLLKQVVSSMHAVNKTDSVQDGHLNRIDETLKAFGRDHKNLHDTVLEMVRVKPVKPSYGYWSTIHRKYPGGPYTLVPTTN